MLACWHLACLSSQDAGADAGADADTAIGEEFEARGGDQQGGNGGEEEEGVKREVAYDELGDK
jgi:hypothetical protein